MTFTAQYTNAENTAVSRSDMPGAAIPVDLGNRHYAEIMAAGIEIAPYVAPPPPVPQTITFRQLVLAALGAAWITPAEAEAWAARNTLPPILSGVIDTLPAADQTAARVTALTMAEADRHDPLMIAVATAAGADSEQIDQFFRQAARLY